MSVWAKVLIGFALISVLIIGTSTSMNIDWAILGDFFAFVKGSMKAFDWLIDYNTQIFVFGSFLFVEAGILLLSIAKFIMKTMGNGAPK